ncbi:MAG: hypothetical protein ABFC94_14790 [Syntrophomonas sp.]
MAFVGPQKILVVRDGSGFTLHANQSTYDQLDLFYWAVDAASFDYRPPSNAHCSIHSAPFSLKKQPYQVQN